MVAVPPRRRPDALQVRAGAGLGHRDRADEFPGRHPRQPVLLLLLRAVIDDVGHDDRVVERDRKTAQPALGRLFVEDDLVSVVAARAAVGLGNGETEKARFGRLRPHRAIDDPVFAPFGRAVLGRMLVEKLPDKLPEDRDPFLVEKSGRSMFKTDIRRASPLVDGSVQRF